MKGRKEVSSACLVSGTHTNQVGFTPGSSWSVTACWWPGRCNSLLGLFQSLSLSSGVISWSVTARWWPGRCKSLLFFSEFVLKFGCHPSNWWVSSFHSGMPDGCGGTWKSELDLHRVSTLTSRPLPPQDFKLPSPVLDQLKKGKGELHTFLMLANFYKGGKTCIFC